MKFTWQNHPDAELIEEELSLHPDSFERAVTSQYLMWLKHGRHQLRHVAAERSKWAPFGRCINLNPGTNPFVDQEGYILFEIDWEELETLAATYALTAMGIQVSDDDLFEFVPPPPPNIH